MGGLAAVIAAATFLVGFALYFTVLSAARYGSLDVDPGERVKFLAAHRGLMYAWNLIIYVLFGSVLVVLAVALHERLKSGASALMQTATAFGLIWAGLVIASGMVANIGAGVVIRLLAKDPALAAFVWMSLSFVVTGLGGGNEIAGGLWLLLVSLAALRTAGLPKALNYLGVVVSVGGLVTVFPALSEVGAVLGMGSIVWFIWLGLVMIRTTPIADIASPAARH